MTRIANPTDRTCGPGRLLHDLAMALLLATLVGRIVIMEMPFRTSPLMAIDTGDGTLLSPSHIDLASMTFGVLVLLAGVLWLAGEALGGRLRIRAGRMGVFIAIFSAWSLVSALQGGDRRGALVFWTNQAALMGSGWLALQLCRDARRRAALLAVLAAVGVMLAVVGLRQVFIDAPDRIADFNARGAEILSARGWTPDSPEAISFKERLFKPVPLGFFSLANIFASVMIVLTASLIGLLCDKWSGVLGDRKSFASTRKPGEIHLPTLSTVLASVGVPLCIAALVLTRSRGALGAAGVSVVGAIVILRFRGSLARCWRKWMLASVLLVSALGAMVVAHGLKHDSLGAKTMTFRWYYWTAGAGIARDNPVFGVGPGGFASAYEASRRPAAEEAVKTPHNFLVHAAAQYGLVGAMLYVCVLGVVLWELARPVERYPDRIEPTDRSGRSPATMLMWIPLVAAVSKCLLGGARGAGGAMLILAAEPAVILAVAMAAVLWWGPRFSSASADGHRTLRVVLACGLAGFVAHNTVSYSFWTPGAAMAFWLAAGAVISMHRPAHLEVKRFRWTVTGLSAAGLATVVICLWTPVARRSWATEMTVDRLAAGDNRGACRWAVRGAECDVLDPIAASDAAGVLHRSGIESYRQRAYYWAKEAIRRQPGASSRHRLAADILWASGRDVAASIEHMDSAVRLDPQSLSMRMEFARRLVSAGMGARAGEQIRAAENIHNALPEDSIFRLNTAQRSALEVLKARAAELDR